MPRHGTVASVRDIHRPDHRVSAYNALRDRARAVITAGADIGMRDIARGTGVRFACIVGCGHSGTSLLASRLGLHPKAFLVDSESYAFVPTVSPFRCRREVRSWAAAALAEGRSLVLEKTPKHVHSLARIARLIHGVQFIAMVRNPLDNVASMKLRFGSLDLAIERWILDNDAVSRAVADRSALLVRYEDMTLAPEREFIRVTEYLGLEWDPTILEEGRTGYSAARNLLKTRVEQVSRAISPRHERWREVLDERQAAQVTARTARTASQIGYA